MKKFLAAALSAVMVFAVLIASSSCSSGGETVSQSEASDTAESAETTPAVTEDARYISDLPESYDLGGFELSVLNRKPISTTLNTFYVAEQNGEPINDAIYVRNSSVCEKYNFSIKETAADDNAVSAGISKMVLAGDTSYYLAIDTQPALVPIVFSDVLYNIFDLPHIDTEKLYWNQDTADMLSLKGKLYYLFGDIMLSDEDVTMVTMYNTSLAGDLGIDENMYEVTRSGGWTFAKMLSLIKLAGADLDGDSAFTVNDRWGLFYADNSAAAPYFGAAEIAFVRNNKAGIPEFSFDRERAESVFSTFREVFNTDGYGYNWGLIKENTANAISSMISNKQILLQNVILSYARRNLRDVTCAFGFLPMPKFDEKQENYSSIMNYVAGVTMFVPASNPETEKTGFALEALCADSSDITDAYINTCLASKYTRDTESFEMIKLTMKNICIDLAYVYNWGGFSNQLTKSIMDPSAEFTSLVASYETKVAEEIAKSMDKLA